jgi:GT2 family glycosyltransferase
MNDSFVEIKEHIYYRKFLGLNINPNPNPNWIVIVLNYNGRKHLKYSLKSLLKTRSPLKFKILVVDNNSSDNSWKYLKKYSNNRKIELLLLKKNYGWSKANNIAMKYMIKKYNPKYFTLANNDIIVHPDWLKACHKAFNFNKKIGICGCTVFGDGEFVPYKFYLQAKKKYQKLSIKITNKFIGGMLFNIRAKTIKLLAFIDEGFFFYGEEADLQVRASKLGIKKAIVSTPIWHNTSSTHKRYKFRASFHQMISQLRLAIKHESFISFLVNFISMLYNIIFTSKIKKLSKTRSGAKRLIPSKYRIINISILIFAGIKVILNYPSLVLRIFYESSCLRKNNNDIKNL